jgi:hypothetical protein
VRAGRSSSKPRAGIAEMKRIEIWFCDCMDKILTRCGVGCNWRAINNRKHFGRLGKQLYRLPNIRLNIIADVGLEETSPTVLCLSVYRMFIQHDMKVRSPDSTW